MKRTVFLVLLAALVLGGFSSCKTEFEQVRISGDTDLIYQKAYAYFEKGDYLKAQTLFELLIPAYRGKKELEDIYFTYAYTFYNDNKFILASYYFENFATTFPNSEKREEAEFMSAYAHYRLSPNFRLDQTYTEDAIDEFQLFINTFPESERVKEANRLIDELRLKLEQKAFAEGKLYFDLRQYQAAVHTLQNVLKDFPETRNSEQIRYLIVRSAYLLAENSIISRQKERFEEVNKYASDFLRKYPESEDRREVERMLENSTEKLNSIENERYQDKSTGTGS